MLSLAIIMSLNIKALWGARASHAHLPGYRRGTFLILTNLITISLVSLSSPRKIEILYSSLVPCTTNNRSISLYWPLFLSMITVKNFGLSHLPRENKYDDWKSAVSVSVSPSITRWRHVFKNFMRPASTEKASAHHTEQGTYRNSSFSGKLNVWYTSWCLDSSSFSSATEPAMHENFWQHHLR